MQCTRCNSFLDVPRNRPGSRSIGRKCPGCLRWQPVSAREQLTAELHIQSPQISRRRR